MGKMHIQLPPGTRLVADQGKGGPGPSMGNRLERGQPRLMQTPVPWRSDQILIAPRPPQNGDRRRRYRLVRERPVHPLVQIRNPDLLICGSILKQQGAPRLVAGIERAMPDASVEQDGVSVAN